MHGAAVASTPMPTPGQVCAVAVLVASACSSAPTGGGERGSGAGTAAPATAGSAGTPTTPPAPSATVTMTGADGPQTVTVEVVRSPALLEKGLMYRKFLPPDHGMLFLMGEDDDHHFWMRNTLIPLDIVFITRELTVAGVIAAKPHDLTSRGVGKQSLYVLEVNGGWMAAHGVGDGAKVTFANVEASAR